PLVASLRHHIPAIQRVSPELPCFAEVVRGHTRDLRGEAFVIKVVELRVRPHISAVMGNKNRNIADDPNAVVIGIRRQRQPLFEEEVLEELVCLDLSRIVLTPEMQGVVFALAKMRIPRRPRASAVMIFDRSEKGIRLEPGPCAVTEAFEL